MKMGAHNNSLKADVAAALAVLGLRIATRSTHGGVVYQTDETEHLYENKFSTAVGLSVSPSCAHIGLVHHAF